MREEIWIPCSSADTSKTKEHAPQPRVKPEAGHLLHATRRFQVCDTFSRQTTETALEGCEAVNAAKTASGQYAPIPLTRMANWKQGGSVSSSLDQGWPFLTEV